MIPVIALVGRPNVGKSTLFNRLTRTQDALVADLPGLTRDRQYGKAAFRNKPYIIIDTGGIGVDNLEVDSLMSKQSTLAIEEADIIFFIVDGRAGISSVDQDITQKLRNLSKPIFLVVNKVDGLDAEIASVDFQSLALGQTYPISASHGRGIENLLQTATIDFPQATADSSDALETTKIAFVGRPNVGKSTLVNRILGEERVVVYDQPGTTRDSISVPLTRANKNYILIDTAGVRKKGRIDEKIEKFSIIKTLQSIQEAHVCLMLFDAKEGVTAQDLHLLGFIIQSGKALVIVVNKWDGLDEEHKERVRQDISRRLIFLNFAKIRYISALHGSGVGLLFKDIDQAYASATRKFSTPKLTQLLQDIIQEHAPPLVNGRRIKMRYAHAGGHNPPLIIIHGNQLEAVPDSYKRYLTKAFTTQLDLFGTPLKIEFKSGQNPYQGKKNKLTESQVRKRKRLIKHLKKSDRK